MKNVKEYSKKIINLMIVLWFIGAAFGAVVIVVELIAAISTTSNIYSSGVQVHIPELLAYIGAPITGGILGYLIKSAMENKEKIRKADTSHDDVHAEDIP